MKICDSHNDFLTEITDIAVREKYLKSLKNKAKIICCSVFTTFSKIEINDIFKYYTELQLYNKKYHTKLILSIEDLGFINNKKDLQELFHIKNLSVMLTWNFENHFAGGAHTNNGLTQLGKDTIILLEKNNILIDTAHLSRKAFYQFSKITTKPIYNSHSNIYSIKKHKRNLTDKQIQKIVNSNGFMGISVYEKFISNKKISCKDIAMQFDYLIKKYGYKNFGLGTDFFGIEKQFLPQDFNNYADIKNLIKELKKLKHSNKIIKAILYKNYENFIKNNFNFE